MAKVGQHISLSLMEGFWRAGRVIAHCWFWPVLQVNFMNLLPGLPEDILAKTKEPLISQAGILILLPSPASFTTSLCLESCFPHQLKHS